MKSKKSGLHRDLRKPFRMLSERFVNLKKETGVIKITCLVSNCEHQWQYKPDLCLVYEKPKHTSHRIIYEIIDAQSPEKTVFDIIRIKFSGNCKKAYFICDNESKLEMAKKAFCITASHLSRLSGGKQKKDFVDIEVIIIPKGVKEEEIFSSLVVTINKDIVKLIPKKEFHKNLEKVLNNSLVC